MKKNYIFIGMLLCLTALIFGTSSGNLNHIQASLSYLTIQKVDATNPELTLEGAVFEVKSQDGSHVETITTDKDGKAVIALNPAIYYITEIKAPQGYVISEENKNIEVDGRSAGGLNLTIKNQKASNATTNEDNQLNAESLSESKPPQTGYTESFLMIAVSLGMISLGIFLFKQNPKHN